MDQPGAGGEPVVDEVIRTMHQNGICADDHGFLKRIAAVESKFGSHPGTYRKGYYGGIWQVDKIGFQETKHRSLAGQRQKMKEQLGVDWDQVTWQDLAKPLNSGLAACLYLSKKAQREPIPADRNGQARYWKKHYNTAAGAGTEEGFLRNSSGY